MAEESGKIDQETRGNDPTQAEIVEGSDSLTQKLSSSVDEGVASEVLEDPSSLKICDASPLPFEFTGKAKEFFGIWLSNLLLSILTLGIYSAWAKVRRRRFFLGHTLIGGHRFDYHADPKVILKGRAVVVSVLDVGVLPRSALCDPRCLPTETLLRSSPQPPNRGLPLVETQTSNSKYRK